MQNGSEISNGTGNGCIPQETVIDDVILAHAYVPFQKMCETFTPLKSLNSGTVFPSLCGLYDHGMKGMCMIDE